MSRPTRPTTVFRTTDRGVVIDVNDGHYRPGRRFLDRSESEVYINAIEQERDEAVGLLRRWEAGPMLEDRAALHQETVLFVERIEGGDNVG